MKQGLKLGDVIEIARFPPEQNVCNEGCSTDDMLAKILELLGEMQKPSKGARDAHHGDQCRNNSLHPPGVESLN